MLPQLNINDYSYPLPDGRIAKYPLPERDSSKLLIYDKGNISHTVFRDLPSYIAKSSLMVFNETRVVPARLFFRRASGAHIEVFCLEPHEPSEYNLAFSATSQCTWKCVIGNAKRLKEGEFLTLYNPSDLPTLRETALTATFLGRSDRTGYMRFDWRGGGSFSSVLEACGQVPIPPYLGRDTEEVDKERYQTLYARIRGSVAAPTAGLHFTQGVLDSLEARGVETAKVCLHVGAGTFLPVKDADVSRHTMHREPFSVSRELVAKLLEKPGKVTAVGTTSVRTLESLYYVGRALLEHGELREVQQWEAYDGDNSRSTSEALEAILRYMDGKRLDALVSGTQIIIVPGFEFRITDAMVTNFHQPESTLILLVSAFLGGNWRPVYEYALENGFRFLSYGDSSLLIR